MGRGASGGGRFRVGEVWRGRYKSRVSGCGRLIVCSMAVPPFFQCVQKRLPGVTQNQAVFPVPLHTSVFASQYHCTNPPYSLSPAC